MKKKKAQREGKRLKLRTKWVRRGKKTGENGDICPVQKGRKWGRKKGSEGWKRTDRTKSPVQCFRSVLIATRWTWQEMKRQYPKALVTFINDFIPIELVPCQWLQTFRLRDLCKGTPAKETHFVMEQWQQSLRGPQILNDNRSHGRVVKEGQSNPLWICDGSCSRLGQSQVHPCPACSLAQPKEVVLANTAPAHSWNLLGTPRWLRCRPGPWSSRISVQISPRTPAPIP